MIEVPAGPGGHGDAEVRSFAACLASVLEIELEEVPAPTRVEPLAHWGRWLAGRGLGLLRPADPGAFRWAGHWIARVEAPDGTRPAVVMFGVPSGVVWDPLDRVDGAESAVVVEAFVLAPLELTAMSAAPVQAGRGRVRGLFVALRAAEPMRAVDAVPAQPGRGLDGDRYARGEGTFSVPGGSGNELTLIAAEALASLTLPGGRTLPAQDARRNVLTEGIDLDALIGRRFRIGEVECIGRRRCEPCAHLQRLTGPGVLRGLVHQGGLRADLLTPGLLRVGDLIEALPGDG